LNWIDLAQDRDKWPALMNTVFSLRNPKNGENFVTSWEAISFSRRAMFHGITNIIIIIITIIFTFVNPQANTVDHIIYICCIILSF
jgi:hypothetical protein